MPNISVLLKESGFSTEIYKYNVRNTVQYSPIIMNNGF